MAVNIVPLDDDFSHKQLLWRTVVVIKSSNRGQFDCIIVSLGLMIVSPGLIVLEFWGSLCGIRLSVLDSQICLTNNNPSPLEKHNFHNQSDLISNTDGIVDQSQIFYDRDTNVNFRLSNYFLFNVSLKPASFETSVTLAIVSFGVSVAAVLRFLFTLQLSRQSHNNC